jgi:hypothetical protein
MELHHQFDAKGFHNVGFAEGTVLVLWSGLLKISNPTAPSNCTPFTFQELQPANIKPKIKITHLHDDQPESWPSTECRGNQDKGHGSSCGL